MTGDPTEQARPKSEHHYAAIGKVAVAWAQFEGTLDHRSILRAEFDMLNGLCFAMQIVGPGRKLNAHMAIAEHRGASDKILNQLRRFQQAALTVAETKSRNPRSIGDRFQRGRPTSCANCQ